MLRALTALAVVALLAAIVGAQFPHPRGGVVVRDSVADEVEPPPAVSSPSPANAGVSGEMPAHRAGPANTSANSAGGMGGGGVQYNAAEAVKAIGETAEKIASDAKQQESSSPPHPSEVAEATKESVVSSATDVPPPLAIPVTGIKPENLDDTFTDARASGARVHDAIDIMAPAGTPVVAVADGRIAKLFLSERGGITVYQFDASERFVYYYAHLREYAPGLAEGQTLHRGDPIGSVGSTGNANPAAPHLHFAVAVLGPEKQWWHATAINPYPLLIAPEGNLAGE